MLCSTESKSISRLLLFNLPLLKMQNKVSDIKFFLLKQLNFFSHKMIFIKLFLILKFSKHFFNEEIFRIIIPLINININLVYLLLDPIIFLQSLDNLSNQVSIFIHQLAARILLFGFLIQSLLGLFTTSLWLAHQNPASFLLQIDRIFHNLSLDLLRIILKQPQLFYIAQILNLFPDNIINYLQIFRIKILLFEIFKSFDDINELVSVEDDAISFDFFQAFV